MSDNGDGAISFFAGFLFGGIIGAGVALLLAPQAGEETREQIRTHGIELKGRAGEAASLAQERAAELEARGKVVLAERKSQVESRAGGRQGSGGQDQEGASGEARGCARRHGDRRLDRHGRVAAHAAARSRHDPVSRAAGLSRGPFASP